MTPDEIWLAKPHSWFAWYPVELMDGEFAWLTTVSRCKINGKFKYRGQFDFW